MEISEKRLKVVIYCRVATATEDGPVSGKSELWPDTPQGNPLAGYGEMVQTFGRRYME